MPTVQSNGITVHYLEEGQGPAVVWIPGGNDHAAMAIRAHETLLDRYRFLAVDPRGQGGTTAFAVAASFAPSLMADDLIGLLDTLGLGRPVVGGHARGARAALEFARTHPARVRAVVAVAPPVQGDDKQRRRFYLQAAEKLRVEGVEPYLKRLPNAPRSIERREEWESYLRNAGAEALAAQYEALARLTPITEDSAGLTMPVQILVGEHDRMIEDARALKEALPAAELTVIPGAGHAPFTEAKQPYFAALESFLLRVFGPPEERLS